MADRKITDLTALTTPASADVLPIVDVSEAAAADKNKKVTVGELFKGIPDGTAAAPAIAFESDDGNGLFLSTTDTIGIATNGVSRATVSTTAVTSTLPISATAFSPTSATVPTNGVYLPATNSVGIATNGTGRLFVDASGNVGVGSTPGASAARVLDINGITLQPILTLRRSSSTSATASIDLDSDNNLVNFISSDFSVRYFINGDERLRITSDGKVGIGTSSPGYKLDVGTTSDASNHINIKTSATGTASFYFSDTNNGQAGIDYNHSTDKLTIRSADATAITIDSSQRVGIGTTSAGTNLSIGASASGGYNGGVYLNRGASSYNFYEASDGTNTVIFGLDNTLSNAKIGSINSYPIGFYTGNVERARIDSSGRLLVGTSSSTDDVRAVFQSNPTDSTLGGAIALSYTSSSPANGDWLSRIDCTDSSANVAARIIAARDGGTWTSGSSHPGRLVFSTTADGASSPTERMRITNSGNIALGGADGVNGTVTVYPNNSNGAAQAQWNRADTANTSTALGFRNAGSTVGSITYTNSAAAYNTSSDYRLKENVTAVTDGITRLQQLKPSRFNFIADPDKTVDGFLAHEVQTVVPEAISGEKDAVDADGNPVYQGIDQSKLVPLLTAALQEAIGRIETLEAEVAALKAS